MRVVELTEGTANTAGHEHLDAGSGTVEVNGGQGADAYVYHGGNFSAAEGDGLAIGWRLASPPRVASSSPGGMLLAGD